MERSTSSEQGEIAAAVAAAVERFAEVPTVTAEDPIARLTGELAAAKGENVQLRQALSALRDADRVACWAALLEQDARSILEWAKNAEMRLAQIAQIAGGTRPLTSAEFCCGRVYELARSMPPPHFALTQLEDVREERPDDAEDPDDD